MGIGDFLSFSFLAALPLVFLHKVIRMAVDFWSFSDWRQIEVNIDDLELTKPAGRQAFTADILLVKVRFSYHYGNASCQGNSVAIPDLAPFPITQYGPATYQPLEAIYGSTKRMHAWVDPKHPERAVLRQVSVRPYLLGTVAMTVCFLGLGYYLIDTVSRTEMEEIGALALVIYLLGLIWSNRLKRT